MDNGNVRTLPRCQGETAAGTPCERVVPSGVKYCYSHDKDRAAERAANASRAARSKVGPELREIKAKLKGLADDVLSGKITPGKASVCSQVYGVLLRTYEQERKTVEVETVKEELAEVRAMYEERERRYS